MEINKSLSLINKRDYIEYNDGMQKEIHTDDIDGLWELIELINKNEFNSEIESWQSKYKYTNTDVNEIIDYLKKSRIIISESDIKRKDHPENRYFNYFNKYSEGLENYNSLKNLKILVIGAGTVGATLSSVLSKFNISELIVIDDDIVNVHNINSQTLFQKNDQGKLKVDIISQRIGNSLSQTKIEGVNYKITSSNVDIIDTILKDKHIDAVISCFDEGNKEIHEMIHKYCHSMEIPYILNGYTDKSVNSVLLYQEHDLNFFDNLDFEEYSFFTNNKGIIIHSLANALLCIEHLLSYVSGQAIKKQRSYFFSYPEQKQKVSQVPNVQFLDEKDIISELIVLKEHIEYKDLNSYLENKIISLYRKVELANFFADYYEDLNWINNQIDEIISYISDDVMDEFDFLEEEYRTKSDEINYVKSILVELNFIKNEDERLNRQKEVYVTIQKKSDDLLRIIVNLKKQHLNENNFNLTYEEEHGISLDNVILFEKVIVNPYEELCLNVFHKLFPNSDGRFDYLFYQDTNSNIQLNKEEYINKTIDAFNNHDNISLFNISFTRLLKKLLENNLIIETQEYIFSSYYLPEHNETVIINNNINNIHNFQLLIHEVGHAYFNKFYSMEFYDKSNTLINEILAHFTEVMVTNVLLNSQSLNTKEKEAYRFQYLYRLNQCVISSFATHFTESRLIDDIQLGKNISTDSFLKIHKDFTDLIPNINFKNRQYSSLNILLFEPFSIGMFDAIQTTLSFSIAIHTFEKYKNNLDLLEYRIETIFNKKEINIESICNILFQDSFNETLIYDILKSIEDHIESF